MKASKKIVQRISLGVLYASLFLISLSACEEDETAGSPPLNGTYSGAKVSVGAGNANSFVTFTNGIPVAVGITMTKGALSELPHADHTAFVLPLPQQKGDIPFQHVTLDWESHGHDPAGVYDLPHFDMHFYMIAEEERLAIDADDPKLEVEPAEKYIPEGYFPTPGFPQMGKHWLDGASPEWNGERFTYTFIYGSYDGKISFYEPMITQEYLQGQPNLVQEIRQPQAFTQSGYFPQSFTVKYDEATEEYRITLEELTFREAE